MLISLEYWPPLARIHWGILSEFPSNLPNEAACMFLKVLPILKGIWRGGIPVESDVTAEAESLQLTVSRVR